MRDLVIRRRVDQDANVEQLRGVQRRPVIHPDHDARDLLAAASAKFEPWPTLQTTSTSGLLGPGPEADSPEGPLHDDGPSSVRVHAIEKSQISHRWIKLAGDQRQVAQRSQ